VTAPLLRLKGVSIGAGHPLTTIVRGVTFDVYPGERVYLVGHTGAGKTTLLLGIYGARQLIQGSIEFLDMKLSRRRVPPMERWRYSMGFSFQDQRLLPHKTVEENVAIPLEVRGIYGTEQTVKVQRVLDIVGLLDRRRDYPTMLSGGERQLVSLARAVVHGPRLILADEPMAGLDNITALRVLRTLERVHEELNITMIIATHNIEMISRRATRVVKLSRGRIVADMYGRSEVYEEYSETF